jgi:hypothetical protein
MQRENIECAAHEKDRLRLLRENRPDLAHPTSAPVRRVPSQPAIVDVPLIVLPPSVAPADSAAAAGADTAQASAALRALLNESRAASHAYDGLSAAYGIATAQGVISAAAAARTRDASLRHLSVRASGAVPRTFSVDEPTMQTRDVRRLAALGNALDVFGDQEPRSTLADHARVVDASQHTAAPMGYAVCPT